MSDYCVVCGQYHELTTAGCNRPRMINGLYIVDEAPAVEIERPLSSIDPFSHAVGFDAGLDAAIAAVRNITGMGQWGGTRVYENITAAISALKKGGWDGKTKS